MGLAAAPGCAAFSRKYTVISSSNRSESQSFTSEARYRLSISVTTCGLSACTRISVTDSAVMVRRFSVFTPKGITAHAAQSASDTPPTTRSVTSCGSAAASARTVASLPGSLTA